MNTENMTHDQLINTLRFYVNTEDARGVEKCLYRLMYLGASSMELRGISDARVPAELLSRAADVLPYNSHFQGPIAYYLDALADDGDPVLQKQLDRLDYENDQRKDDKLWER